MEKLMKTALLCVKSFANGAETHSRMYWHERIHWFSQFKCSLLCHILQCSWESHILQEKLQGMESRLLRFLPQILLNLLKYGFEPIIFKTAKEKPEIARDKKQWCEWNFRIKTNNSKGFKNLPFADLTITLIRLLTESKLRTSNNSNLQEKNGTKFILILKSKPGKIKDYQHITLYNKYFSQMKIAAYYKDKEWGRSYRNNYSLFNVIFSI